MWPAAGAAWNSALDALLGPYQVVDSWTRKLDLSCSWQQLLGRYGVHGLLLAGTLLGKLARWAAGCALLQRARVHAGHGRSGHSPHTVSPTREHQHLGCYGHALDVPYHSVALALMYEVYVLLRAFEQYPCLLALLLLLIPPLQVHTPR
jgi:hypothetical protein